MSEELGERRRKSMLNAILYIAVDDVEHFRRFSLLIVNLRL